MSDFDAPLVRLYDTVFDRAPDPEGRAFWTDSLAHGYSFTVLAGEFMRAPEFAASYGQPTNRAFVESLYRNILDRPGEAEGIDFWTAALDGGRAQRAETVIGFSESREHVVHMGPPQPRPRRPRQSPPRPCRRPRPLWSPSRRRRPLRSPRPFRSSWSLCRPLFLNPPRHRPHRW